MKKILSIISSFFITIPTLAIASACAGPKTNWAHAPEPKFKDNIKDVELSSAITSQEIEIIDYQKNISNGYSYSVEIRDVFQDNDKPPFEVGQIDANGFFTIKKLNYGRGQILITCSNGGDDLDNSNIISVECIPIVELYSYNQKNDQLFPNNIIINENQSGFPTSKVENNNNDISFSIANYAELHNLGYDISYNFLNYRRETSEPNPLNGETNADNNDYKFIIGNLDDNGDSNVYFTKDDNGNIVFNLKGDKFKNAGHVDCTVKAVLSNSAQGVKTKELFSNLFAGLVTFDYSILSSNQVQIYIYAYSQLKFDYNDDSSTNLSPSSATFAKNFYNADHFYTVNDPSAKEKYKVSLTNLSQQTLSYTTALLLPLSYFQSYVSSGIGLSGTLVYLKDGDNVAIKVYRSNNENITVINEETGSDFSGWDSDNNEIVINKTGKYLVSDGGSFSSEIEVRNWSSTIILNPISQSLDLSTSLSVLKKEDISSVDTASWNNKSATYAHIPLLAPLMDNEKDFALFYYQSYSSLNFAFNLDVDTTKLNGSVKFLTAVLPGKVSITNLPSPVNDDDNDISIYDDLINSVSSLYLGTITK